MTEENYKVLHVKILESIIKLRKAEEVADQNEIISLREDLEYVVDVLSDLDGTLGACLSSAKELETMRRFIRDISHSLNENKSIWKRVEY